MRVFYLWVKYERRLERKDTTGYANSAKATQTETNLYSRHGKTHNCKNIIEF